MIEPTVKGDKILFPPFVKGGAGGFRRERFTAPEKLSFPRRRESRCGDIVLK